MKTLLALDLGTNTGFACGNAGHHISGTWDLERKKGEKEAHRLKKFVDSLDTLHKASGFTAVCYEEVARHRGTKAAHLYGYFKNRLKEWCFARDIECSGVPVGTIKKFCTGKGNAGKPEMIEGVREWGYEPADDNEADAIAILRLKLVETGEAKQAAREAA